MKKRFLSSFFALALCLAWSPVFISGNAKADAELEKQLKDVVMADTALSVEAKGKLVAIIENVTIKNEEIQIKIREQKVQLLKALLAKPGGSNEAKNLRRSLIKLNDERLENSLKALESLKEVLGHQKNPEILFNKILEAGGRY
jgi:hypothetical protein